MTGSTLGGGITINVDAREPGTRESRWLAGGRSLLGGIIAGLAANIIGGAYPLVSSLAIAAAVVFVAVIAVQLRRLPARAPVHRLVARAGLGGAALAVVASLLVPPTWTGWAVLLAATLGMAGSLTPASTHDTYQQIGGAALVGFGVAVVGGGVSVLLGSELLGGVAVVGGGVAMVGGGVSVLLRSELLGGVAMVGLGVALVGFGVSVLLRSELLGGVAFVGLGVAFVGVGVSVLLRSELLAGVAVVGGGVAMVGVGVSLLLRSELLAGVAVVGLGVAFVGVGVSLLLRSELLAGVAVVSGGVALVGSGVSMVSPSLTARIRQLVSDPPPSSLGPLPSPPDNGTDPPT